MKINEIFPSINGECNAYHQGSLCTFVRLQGCNKRCSFCDTPHAQNSKTGIEMSVNKVFEEIESLGNKIVTITGGEPLLQLDEVNALCTMLWSDPDMYDISIETNGTIFVPTYLRRKASIVMDYKLGSAGLNEKPNRFLFESLTNSDFVKFVCSDWFDFQEALSFTHNLCKDRLSGKPKMVFSPAMNPNVFTDIAVDLCTWMQNDSFLREIGAIYSLQIHKILKIR